MTKMNKYNIELNRTGKKLVSIVIEGEAITEMADGELSKLWLNDNEGKCTLRIKRLDLNYSSTSPG